MSDYFFCYNKNLFTFIHDNKQIDYITVAQNPKTKKIFALFKKGDHLQTALDEYKAESLHST